MISQISWSRTVVSMQMKYSQAIGPSSENKRKR